MKILFTVENLIPPRGGAERSAFALAQSLAKDFEVKILTPHDKDIIKKEKGYTLIAKKRPFYFKFLKSFFKINMQFVWWRKVLKKTLEKEKYEVIMTQGILVPSFYNLKTNAKKIIFIRGFPAFTPNVNENPMKIKEKYFRYLPFIFKIQYPLVRFFQKKGLETLKEEDIILISNSDYTRKVTKFYTGRDSPTIYPPIKIEDYKIKNKKNQKYILFVNPTLSKGVNLMYNIAKNMPDKKFLVVGKTDISGRKYYNLLKNLKNITIFHYKLNMKEVYNKTWLLVSPVDWYEPFGRTPAEAMVNGIPSIVSDRGGLPEVVGNSGDIVKNINNTKEWIKIIKKYDVKEYYKKKSELCKKRVEKFSLDSQYKKLKSLLDDLKIK